MSVTIGSRIRKGKTKYETMLQSLFEGIGVNPLIDQYICLRCGGIYQLLTVGNYPKSCKKCGDFSEAGSYIMPDLVIKHHDGYDDSIGVIYVNGAVHTKPKQAKKDENQIEKLIKLGYRVYVFENEDVTALYNQKTFITHAALKFIYESIKFHYKYQELLTNEKEMAGVHIIKGGLASIYG